MALAAPSNTSTDPYWQLASAQVPIEQGRESGTTAGTPHAPVPDTSGHAGVNQIGQSALDDINAYNATVGKPPYTLNDVRSNDAASNDAATTYNYLLAKQLGPDALTNPALVRAAYRVGLAGMKRGDFMRIPANDTYAPDKPAVARAASALNVNGAGNPAALGTDLQQIATMFPPVDSSRVQPTIDALKASLVAQRAETEGIQRQTEADYTADRLRARTAYDAANKDDTTPWTQPPPPRDALQGFASAGSIFAAIASAFTRTPALSAMNGMAAAINARRNGDQQAYDQAYKVWEANTKLAIDRQKLSSDRLTQALEMMKTDQAHGLALMNQAVTEHGDDRVQIMAAAGAWDKVDAANQARIRAMATFTLGYEKIKYPTTKSQLFVGPNGEPMILQTLPDGQINWKSAAGQPIQPPTNAPTRVASTPPNSELLTPEQEKSMGAQLATGQPIFQVVPGWGASATVQRKQARDAAIKQIMSENPGMTPEKAGVELANRSLRYVAAGRSTTQLTTMLGATRQGVAQLDFNVQKTKEEMAKLPSTDLSPVLNSLVRGEERWTGDPAYSSLFYYMQATALESARILAGGQASVAQLHQGAMDEAKHWADIGLTPSMFDSVAKSMEAEGQNRIETYEGALRYQGVGPPPPSSPSAPAQGSTATPPPGPHTTIFTVTPEQAKNLPSGSYFRGENDPPGGWRYKP